MRGVITNLRSTLNLVVESIKSHLITYCEIDPSRVIIIGRHQRTIPNLSGDQDFLIRILGFRPVPGLQDRHDYRVYQRIAVIIRSRWELDQADSDEIKMTDPVGGNIVYKEEVLDALLNYIPEDGAGNTYCYEGISLLEGLEPNQFPPEEEWEQQELIFNLPIRLPLSQKWS